MAGLITLASYHANATHAPGDPQVSAAYCALIQELRAQYARIPLRVTFEESDPYGVDSRAMRADVSRGRLRIFAGGTMPGDHPLAGEGNLLFRACHDYFGHAVPGNSFSVAGEVRAFQVHARMFSREALPALAAETLAQTAVYSLTGNYAEQKALAVPFALIEEYLDYAN